ncbi:MAG TPA: ATP-dependent helicase, partial [Armatimonadota bacterium]|nr:ATP-dependent helicase [Armatimonadota bacterium]
MVLIWEDGRSRWECISNYAERTIPKEAKFTWDPDPDVKRWYTHDLSKAVKLSAYADPITRQRLEREVKLRKELREASHATDADVDLPRPEGLDYLPFQRAGILVGTKINNVLIADEQGLGKTIQFLGIVNA